MIFVGVGEVGFEGVVAGGYSSRRQLTSAADLTPFCKWKVTPVRVTAVL